MTISLYDLLKNLTFHITFTKYLQTETSIFIQISSTVLREEIKILKKNAKVSRFFTGNMQ